MDHLRLFSLLFSCDRFVFPMSVILSPWRSVVLKSVWVFQFLIGFSPTSAHVCIHASKCLWASSVFWMNEWCIYIALFVYCCTPKALYNHVGGLSSTTTSGGGFLSLTHTHTHTHTFDFVYCGDSHVMVFILYKPYFLSPYPLQETLCIFAFSKKNEFCMIYKPFEIWGHGEMSS